MKSSYLNMAAGAFLGTCFVAMSLSIVSGAIYSSPEPEKEGFAIEPAEEGAGAATAPKKEEVPPIAPLLAKADIEEGQSVFKKCQACHSGEKGGPNKIGPNLWGVVGRPIASHEGFSYSSAMKEYSKGGEEHWTYEHLNHFIHDPRGYVSGTAMTFPGVKDDQERADVIAYLHSLADEPVPFPEPKAEEAKSEGANGNAQPDAQTSGEKSSGGQSGATQPSENSGDTSDNAGEASGGNTGNGQPVTRSPDGEPAETPSNGDEGGASGTVQGSGEEPGQTSDQQSGQEQSGQDSNASGSAPADEGAASNDTGGDNANPNASGQDEQTPSGDGSQSTEEKPTESQ